MRYFVGLFSPQTHEAFSSSDRTITGFPQRLLNVAGRVSQGDKFLCYVTQLSRWCGVLEVVQGPCNDSSPLFGAGNPFPVCFKVNPIAWLPVDRSIPIHDECVWSTLSFTRRQSRNLATWTGRIRGGLRELEARDGTFLEGLIKSQVDSKVTYPIDEAEYRRLIAGHDIRRADKDVYVSVPEDIEQPREIAATTPDEIRESIKVQALLAEIGARMGMRIWIPRNDRTAVISQWSGDHGMVLDRLPLNYDDTTLKTIEQIDILWLRGRAIKRAFEIEHTKSIYSGILRMADLLALQPNMDIRLHIVAPLVRREKVFQEIRRPVFSLLDRGPLSESCSFVSYDSVKELAQQPHLSHLSDSVMDEYEEDAAA